jgi:hypothetical protein
MAWRQGECPTGEEQACGVRFAAAELTNEMNLENFSVTLPVLREAGYW